MATNWIKSFSAACCLLMAPAAFAGQVNIAAIVGDDVITTADVNARRDLIMGTVGIPATVENQQRITPRILQSLVDETLEMQEAKRQSISISDEELKQAIDQMRTRDNTGPVREFVTSHGLSMPSLESQVRADLSWGKVVQKKLRRNVSIAQDEVTRAQLAAASAPGETDLRIQAIELSAKNSKAMPELTKTAQDILASLATGTPMQTIAGRMLSNAAVHYSQPTWVPESKLPPALQQVLSQLQPGQYTSPLQTGSTIQILQLMDRKTDNKLSGDTQYTLKQFTVDAPASRSKASLAALSAAAAAIKAHPGSCDSAAAPAASLPVQVNFATVKISEMNEAQKQIVAHLKVGDLSEPLLAPEKLRLVMICEKIEPARSNLPDAEKIRQQLYAEKLELEAQKLLRNLRRDAYIDIKSAQ